MNLTRMVVSCIKTHNEKLCRKGLLERSIKMKLYIGDFKNFENGFLKETFNPNGSKNEAEMKSKLNAEKEAVVIKSIKKLKTALETLDKTINTLKKEVSSLIKKENYDAWEKRIGTISNRFKSLYSDMNNELYNYHYKMSIKEASAWNNIFSDSNWIDSNICSLYTNVNELVVDFEEGDINGLFCIEKEQNNRKRKSESGGDLADKTDKIQKRETMTGDNRNEDERKADEVGEIDASDFEELLRTHLK